MSIVKNSNEVQSSAATKFLWIGFPPCIPIHEQRLYNALILLGEIESIRIFPTTHHALVEFRSAEEARRTKDGIQGRLFADPRIQVLYSNGENGPAADHKVNSSFLSPSLPRARGGPSPSESGSQFGSVQGFGLVRAIGPSGSQFGSVQGFGQVRAIGPTFPPQGNLHGTQTLTRVSLPAPGPTFHKFPERVNINSSGPGNLSKSRPVIDPTNSQRPNLHGTEPLRNVSLPAPVPTFHNFSGSVNINNTGPVNINNSDRGNWSKSPPVIPSTQAPQKNLHGTQTHGNASLSTPAPRFHQFPGPVNINSSGPGNCSKSPQVIVSTNPPQTSLHGTETLKKVVTTSAPMFHKFSDPVNINSFGPGNWNKSPPASTYPLQKNLHGTETLRNVSLPTPAPTFHQFSDPVNITSSVPGNWSKPTQFINTTNPSQANQHGTETLRNVPLPTPTPTPTPGFTFQKFSDPVNINSSGPGNWSKPPQVIGSTTPPDRNLHGTETLRNVPLPTSAFTFHKFADPADINSSAPANWSKSAPVMHLPINAWDEIVSERESKRARIDEGLPITGTSGTSTSIPAEMGSGPVPNNIWRRSYGEVSQQVNTGNDNQNMGETVNLGPNGNGSHDQFPVGVEPLLTPNSAARTDQEDCYGDGSCFWQGTIAKSGSPICNARCISVSKSIEAKFPEVLNCSARTDLEMVIKHFYRSCGFALYYFMPESDQDAKPYQKFLEYLSSKNRAYVAEFSDGTTLFLVPPSDFSEHVLKAPDRSHVFGVVLKFLHQQGNAMQQTTMLSQSPLQLHDKRQQFPFSTQMPMKEHPTQSATDNMPRSLSTLNGMHTDQIASPEMTNQIPGTQPVAISLTPDLIATLASRFTNKFRASVSGDSPSAPITSTGHDQPNNNQNITSLVASQQKSEPVEGGPASQQTLFSHVQEGLRTGNELPRHGNESLEMEASKNRSYQATLQLAANLLRELKQKGNKQI